MKATRHARFGRSLPLHLMVWPAAIMLFIFNYIPFSGILIAFQDYKPWLGITRSAWIGLDQFREMFTYRDSRQVIINTFYIASFKIVLGFLAPLVFSLLLNEVRRTLAKRFVQTLVYLPHFLSWVILGGILVDMLSTKNGIVNLFLVKTFGIKPIFFLGDGDWFRVVVIASDIWKEFGFAAIVYLAALAGINPALYEAAEVDGASRWKQTLHVTIPGMLPIAVVLGILSLGNIFNAGFDQIFNLYNPLVYNKGDIIDTFVYRVGFQQGDFSFGTAVGLFKSVVALVLIVLSYRIAYKYTSYRIF